MELWNKRNNNFALIWARKLILFSISAEETTIGRVTCQDVAGPLCCDVCWKYGIPSFTYDYNLTWSEFWDSIDYIVLVASIEQRDIEAACLILDEAITILMGKGWAGQGKKADTLQFSPHPPTVNARFSIHIILLHLHPTVYSNSMVSYLYPALIHIHTCPYKQQIQKY